MESDLNLPDVPPGTARLGWMGFALALPEKWNLSLHSPAATMARQGLLVFSDLRGPAFEIRWQTPRKLKLLRADPRQALQRAAAKLRRRGTVDLQADACLLQKKGLALVAGPRHLFELHCPRNPELIAEIARDFRVTLLQLAAGPWLWSVYGVHAWLPPTVRLCDIAMRAGDCRLKFRIPAAREARTAAGFPLGNGDGTLTLAGFSLAHQILRNRSLRAWAGTELTHVRDHPEGTWEESGDQASWRTRTRRLGRLIAHETHIRHDPLHNRIHWTHLQQHVKNGG